MPALLLSALGRDSRRGVVRLLLGGVLAAVGVIPSMLQPELATAEAPGLATVAAETPLLSEPDAAATVLVSLRPGSQVVLSGSAAPGYLQVMGDGEFGWVDADDLAFGDRVGIPLEDADEEAQILAAPLPRAEVLGTVPPGGVVILTGADVGGFVAASYEGIGGWVSEASLGMAYDADYNAS